MRFPEAVNACLDRYATFGGRARRPEYWYFMLFGLLVSAVTGVLDAVIFPGNAAGPVSGIASLLLLLPSLAVTARRLHDTGRSGWWMLTGLVPLIGWLVLIVWFCRPGDAGPNRFGPGPAAGGGFAPVPGPG